MAETEKQNLQEIEQICRALEQGKITSDEAIGMIALLSRKPELLKYHL